MEGIAVDYFPSSIGPGNNGGKYEFHSYISDYNDKYACDSHAYIFHKLKKIESGILVSGMSIVWEDTYVCSKQYMCALAIYLMTVL